MKVAFQMAVLQKTGSVLKVLYKLCPLFDGNQYVAASAVRISRTSEETALFPAHAEGLPINYTALIMIPSFDVEEVIRLIGYHVYPLIY